MRRSALPPRRSPIRRVSLKRAKQNREYTKKRKAFLALWPVCQICESDVSTEIHHKNHRHGARLNDETQFMALCGGCHRYVHNNPAEARKRGWLV